MTHLKPLASGIALATTALFASAAHADDKPSISVCPPGPALQ